MNIEWNSEFCESVRRINCNNSRDILAFSTKTTIRFKFVNFSEMSQKFLDVPLKVVQQTHSRYTEDGLKTCCYIKHAKDNAASDN